MYTSTHKTTEVKKKVSKILPLQKERVKDAAKMNKDRDPKKI
jgi:hypothetical protein